MKNQSHFPGKSTKNNPEDKIGPKIEACIRKYLGRFDSESDLTNHVFCELMDEKNNSKEKVEAIHSRLKNERCASSLNTLIKYIKYNGNTLDYALKMMTDFISPALLDIKQARLVAFAFLHFIWQVKRKIVGLPVDQHLVIILIQKKQGEGKSQFIENLVAPIGNSEPAFLTRRTLQQLSDERHQKVVAFSFVSLLDDCYAPKKISLPSIKSLITSTHIEPRVLCHNKTDRCKIRTTFIGSCNGDSMDDIFPDDTGMRRFFPVFVDSFINVQSNAEMHQKLQLCSTVPEFQYPKLWDSTPLWRLVNEHWECFLPVDEVREYQRGQVTLTPVQELFAAYNVKLAEEESDGIFLSVTHLQDLIKKNSQIHEYSTRKVGAELRVALGSKPHRGGPRKNNDGYFLTGNFKEAADILRLPWLTNLLNHRAIAKTVDGGVRGGSGRRIGPKLFENQRSKPAAHATFKKRKSK